MSTEMDKNIILVKSIVVDLEGLSTLYLGSALSDDMYSLIQAAHPILLNFVSEYGEFEMSVGFWIHTKLCPGDDCTDWGYYSYQYLDGEFVWYNLTHGRILDITTPFPHGPEITNASNLDYKEYIKIKEEFPTYQYTLDTSLFYSQEHRFYDYWVGELNSEGFVPFWSYSIGTGPIRGVGNETLVYASNPWFGSSIKSLSNYLRDITPPDSNSFFVDINRDFLLAVSDDVEIDVMCDMENYQFMSPRDYAYYGSKISNVYEKIMGDESLLEELRSSETGKNHQMRVGDSNVLIRYFRELSNGESEWLLCNIKSYWTIQESVFVQSLCLLSIVIAVGGCLGCFWCCFICRARRNVKKLVGQFEKITTMELDDIKYGLFSFYEIRYIEKKLKKTVEILKNYRQFLPENLLLKEEFQQGCEELDILSSTTTSSSKSTIISPTNSPSGKSSGDNNSLNSGHLSCHTGSSGSEGHSSSLSSSSSSSSSLFGSEFSYQFQVTKKLSKFDLGISKTVMIGIYIVFGYRNMCMSLNRLYEIILTGRRLKGFSYIFDFDSIFLLMSTQMKKSGEESLKKCLLTAMNTIEAIRRSLDNNDISGVRIFLCTSLGFHGVLGNDSIKKFCLGGPIVKRLREMARASPFSLDLVSCWRSFVALRENYTSRCVFVMPKRRRRIVDDEDDEDESEEEKQEKQEGKEECKHNFIKKEEVEDHEEEEEEEEREEREKVFCCFQLGREKSVTDNEWMYEISQMEEWRRWDDWNDAIKSCFRGEWENARLKFSDHLKNLRCASSSDLKREKKMTRYWTNRIEKNMNRVISNSEEEDKYVTEVNE